MVEDWYGDMAAPTLEERLLLLAALAEMLGVDSPCVQDFIYSQHDLPEFRSLSVVFLSTMMKD